MGILRGIAKALGGLVFSAMLTAFVLDIGLVQLTERDNFRSLVAGVLGPQISASLQRSAKDTDFEKVRQELVKNCEGKEFLELPGIDMGGPNGTIMIKVGCDYIRNVPPGANASAEILGTFGRIVAESVADTIYNKAYSCEFVQCLQEGQTLVVLSAEGNAFFESMQLMLVAGTVAGVALVLVSAESWSERLKSIGVQTALVGVSYFLIRFGKDYAISKLPAETQSKVAEAGIEISGLADKILGPMMTNLLIVFAVGVALAAAGYVLASREKTQGQIPGKQK